uniref:THAP-type domain-containing protein n=1 Tax=Paramormyrops kingsleyae TaxID=1676925 RepID=A0A3B3QI30_9TELE
MGKSCCATGCTNRFNKKSELSFYRLPKNKERRSKWIAAIGRSNWNPGSETWICGFHFASGKKSDDPLHPDYVPSIFSFTSPTNQTRPVNNLKKYQGSQEVSGKRFANTSREQTAAGGLNLHQNPASDVEDYPIYRLSCYCSVMSHQFFLHLRNSPLSLLRSYFLH